MSLIYANAAHRLLSRTLLCSAIALSWLALVQRASAVTWTGGGANAEWATVANWGGMNPSGQPVLFDDSTDTSGTPSEVAASINVTNLNYTNATSAHHTQIQSSQTLTVSGPFTKSGAGATEISGGGALIVNGSFAVTDGNPNLNLANLNSFTVNAGSGNFNIATTTSSQSTGQIVLGTTNSITAATINVGNAGHSPGGLNNFMELGQTNTLHANTINVGRSRNNGTIRYRTSGLTGTPTTSIRGSSGGSSRAAVEIAGQGAGSSATTGLMDFSLGSVDAMISTLVVSRASGSPSGGVNGTFTMSAGTVDALSVILGQKDSSNNANGSSTGTLNLQGGEFIANTIFMGDRTNTPTPPTNGAAAGIINLTGGTLRASSITKGVSPLGTATINFTSGTLSHKTGTDLTIAPDVSLRLLGSGVKDVHAEAGRTVNINSVVQNSGGGPFAGLTKTGGGTLLLNGTSTYTGDTLVNAGILGGGGSLASTVVVASGGTLSPGQSAGTFTVGNLNLQSGGTLRIELGGTTPGVGGYDQLIVTGTADLAGQLELVLLPGFVIDPNDTFTILDAGSISGTFSNAFTTVSLANGVGYFDISFAGGEVTLSNFQVPEPGSLGLLAIGSVLLMRRSRRRRARFVRGS